MNTEEKLWEIFKNVLFAIGVGLILLLVGFLTHLSWFSPSVATYNRAKFNQEIAAAKATETTEPEYVEVTTFIEKDGT